MSVIAHLGISANSFELGRLLEVESGASIRLEDVVWLGTRGIPLLSVEDTARDGFEDDVRDHSAVETLQKVSDHGNRTLYALEWPVSRDPFFRGLSEVEATLLNAVGGTNGWTFEVRLPDYDALTDLREHCSDAQIPVELRGIYRPTKVGPDAEYGLSDPQRDALVLAVRGGYYSIPRELSTKELAAELDISDQAVTERLRRAIVTLVEHTIFVASDDGDDPFTLGE